jgi:hypothetical protein
MQRTVIDEGAFNVSLVIGPNMDSLLSKRFSLRHLSELCGSAVRFLRELVHRRDAEDAENAPEKSDMRNLILLSGCEQAASGSI